MTECKQCGHCCTYLEFNIPNHPLVLEFYRARGVELFSYDTHSIIRVPHRCPHLTADMKCDIHETKPVACQVWPQVVDGYPHPCKGIEK